MGFHDLESFLVENRKLFADYDIFQFESGMEALTERVLLKEIHLFNIKPAFYIKYLDKSINDLDAVSINSSEMSKFFIDSANRLPIESKNISIPFKNENIVKRIRPDFIHFIPRDFAKFVDKVMNDKKDVEDVRRKYIDGTYFDKMKKDLVDASREIDMKNIKNEIKQIEVVYINETYIRNNIVTYLTEFESKRAELHKISTITKGDVTKSFDKMMLTINMINKYIKEHDLPEPKLNLLQMTAYNVFRGYMKCAAYLCLMVMYKANMMLHNINQIIYLHNAINEYFPEYKVLLKENVLDGDIENIDAASIVNDVMDKDISIFTEFINRTVNLKKIEIANYTSRKKGYKINFTDEILTKHGDIGFLSVPYDECIKSYDEILSNIEKLKKRIPDSEVAIDDILVECNLYGSFIRQYDPILTSINNSDAYAKLGLSQYDNNYEEKLMILAYNEIMYFSKFIPTLYDKMREVYEDIENLRKDLKNDNYKIDEIRKHEYEYQVDNILFELKSYIVLTVKKCVTRLRSLASDIRVTGEEITDEIEPFVPFDYTTELATEAYRDIEDSEELIFEKMMFEYNVIRNKVNRGVDIIYEDTETNQSENNDNVSSTPKAETDANKQNKENGDYQETDKDQNGPKNNDNKTGLLERFSNFIKRIIEKFKQKIKEIAINHYNKWLANSKSAILSLDFSNTNITTASYEFTNKDRINSDINGAKSVINSISTNDIPADLRGTDVKAQRYIFKNIPEKINGQDLTSFSEKIKYYYTYGDKAGKPMTTWSKDDAKTRVEKMIAFCENYSTNATAIADALQRLADDAKKKQEGINNSQNKGNNTPNNNENGVSLNSVVTSVVRDYEASILTVYEKKYFDFIKVLKTLSPNKNVKNENNAGEEE